jgi:molybdate transport system substrate-binding protein
MSLRRTAWTCLLLIFLAARPAPGEEIIVAAASDLKFAMAELTGQFEKQTGHKINVTYGSSGNFFSQIQTGAPFDAFFSADIEYPRKLEAAGLAEAGTLYKYAIGRIVIWTPAGSPVDAAKRGWDALLDPAVQKISIANPKHAPYGRAAVAALQKAGIYAKVEAKLVYGEDISQAAQFVQSGNAQAGIIALSVAVSPAMRDAGSRWEIPEDAYPPIEQAAIMLKVSQKKGIARAFLEFVKSPAGRTMLKKSGFTIPHDSLAPAKFK